jgi:CRISPR/Cas system-associated exonuclease Cas4 (RecB family)
MVAEMLHHPTLSPSSMPMLEQCPCFERADDAISLEPKPKPISYRGHGNTMHKVFEAQLRGEEPAVDGLTLHECEGIDWAVDYVRTHITTEHPIEIEQSLVLMDEAFRVITFGTGDVINGMRLFDLKTGDYHNYWLQMACYALMQMDRMGVDEMMVLVMFTRFKKVHELVITREEAYRRIMAVVEAVTDPDKKPKANPYCKWCRKVMTCEAIIHLVSGTEITRYEIDDPNELGHSLRNARILKEWVSRIEEHAKRLALSGTEIPGFELKSRAGAREIMDVKKAYELSGLGPDEFIMLCSLPVGALEDAIAVKEEIPKSRAKKLVNERLGEVLQRRPPSVHLALTKNAEEPTEK